MESVNKLEKTIEGWLKPIPHLPATWRKWLGENLWWLTLIGVILSVIVVFTIIGAMFTAMSFLGSVNSIYGMYGITTASYSGWWMMASVASLVFMVVTVAISSMAISPLKVQKKKGWDLLFLVFIVNIVSSVVSVILNFNMMTLIPGLIGTAIGAAISAYFLLEVKSQFNGVTAVSKK